MQKLESSKTSIPSHLNNPLSPKQVCVMQKPMLDPIVACLLHGISQAAESEIARKSVEALDALASHTLTSPPQPPAPSLLDVYPLLQVCSRSRFVSLSLARSLARSLSLSLSLARALSLSRLSSLAGQTTGRCQTELPRCAVHSLGKADVHHVRTRGAGETHDAHQRLTE